MNRIGRSESGDAADGLRNRFRLADTAGLYDNVVELSARHQFIQLLNEVSLQGTADAAVLQSHQAVILLGHHSPFLNEGRVYIDLAYIIDYHRKPDPLPIREDMVDQCCLAAAEISCQQQYRHFFQIHLT